MLRLPRIEIHSADHCVQKCAHCSHAADIAPKRIYGPEDYLPHLRAMHEKGVRWGSIEILGGEPFINPRLEELVDMLFEFETYRVVMSNMFWLKSESDIDKYASLLGKIQTLVVTLYSPLVEKAGGISNVGPLLDKIKERFPRLKIHSFGDLKTPVSLFGTINFSKTPLPIVNQECAFRGCKQLMHDGRLIGCCSARRVLNWDEVDVFNLKSDWQLSDLESWYNQPILNLCKHCSIATKGVDIVPWSLVK